MSQERGAQCTGKPESCERGSKRNRRRGVGGTKELGYYAFDKSCGCDHYQGRTIERDQSVYYNNYLANARRTISSTETGLYSPLSSNQTTSSLRYTVTPLLPSTVCDTRNSAYPRSCALPVASNIKFDSAAISSTTERNETSSRSAGPVAVPSDFGVWPLLERLPDELVAIFPVAGLNSGFLSLQTNARQSQLSFFLSASNTREAHLYLTSSPSAIAWFIRSKPVRNPLDTPDRPTMLSGRYDFHHEYLCPNKRDQHYARTNTCRRSNTDHSATCSKLGSLVSQMYNASSHFGKKPLSSS